MDDEEWDFWKQHRLLDEMRIVTLAPEGGRGELLDKARKEFLALEDCKPVDGDGLWARLWDGLSQDIVKEILFSLSPKAIGRLRCVCRKWNRLLHTSKPLLRDGRDKSPSPCMIMCDRETGKALFFCLREQKWVRLPHFSVRSHLYQATWDMHNSDIVDINAGLLCYRKRRRDNVLSLAVFNPMTQFSRVLPPLYCNGAISLVKLVVDREARNFQVIVVTENLTSVLISECWVQSSNPFLGRSFNNFFIRKNFFFMWSSCALLLFKFDIKAAASDGRPTWRSALDHELDLPDKTHRFDHHFLLDSEDSIMLVQLNDSSKEPKEPMLIWKLQSSGPLDDPEFSPASWELVTVSSHPDMRIPLPDTRSLISMWSTVWCPMWLQAFMFDKNICFTWETDKWLMYSLASKTWYEMPQCGEREGGYHDWLSWEPIFDDERDHDMGLSYPETLEAQR